MTARPVPRPPSRPLSLSRRPQRDERGPQRCDKRRVGQRDERGVSLSVFVTALVPLLVLLVGLVVDGASRVAEARSVSVVAAQAARAGSDASAADRLAGGSGASAAVQVASASLAAHGVQGSAEVRSGRLLVHTTGQVSTLFLSIIGVRHFTVSADAAADLVSA